MNPDTKRFLSTQVIWMAISLGVSLAISILLPFPLSIAVIIGVFLGMSYLIRRRQLRLMGMRGVGSSFPGINTEEASKVSYFCISCGMKHDETACPNCGSRMKRAQF